MHFNCRGRNKMCYNFVVHLLYYYCSSSTRTDCYFITLLQYLLPATRDIVDSLQKAFFEFTGTVL